MKRFVWGLTLLSSVLSGCVSHSAISEAPKASTPVANTNAGTSKTLADTGRDPAQFPMFIEQLKQQARDQGFSENTIDRAFRQVHFINRVISADRNQLEKKITLDDYLVRVLPAWKIKQGQEMAKRYQSQLAVASSRYGVPAPYIVALWGMESSFGKIQGKDDIISAMSTLAFEGRREAFFTKQVMAALTMIEHGYVAPEQLKGSWAGAMGQCQFMPTSLLTYGVDSNGDGKIDIWNNVNDVFASTANYLKKEGWEANSGWGLEVTLPTGFAIDQAGLKNEQSKSVTEWMKKGVSAQRGALSPSDQQAWIIIPDDGRSRAFLVYNNFRVLMHWNRSYYFGISVGMMADAIASSAAYQ